MADGMATVSGLIAKLGVILPFDVITTCLLAYPALVGVWSAFLFLRYLVWVFNR